LRQLARLFFFWRCAVWRGFEQVVYRMQNTAYRGTDFMLFSKPKFFFEMRMPYLHL
jgi:hypothetical protein